VLLDAEKRATITEAAHIGQKMRIAELQSSVDYSALSDTAKYGRQGQE
jgi:hypothetical protein